LRLRLDVGTAVFDALWALLGVTFCAAWLEECLMRFTTFFATITAFLSALTPGSFGEDVECR
jgi:hypothetical protein